MSYLKEKDHLGDPLIISKMRSKELHRQKKYNYGQLNSHFKNNALAKKTNDLYNIEPCDMGEFWEKWERIKKYTSKLLDTTFNIS